MDQSQQAQTSTLRTLFVFLFSAFLLSGCASFGEEQDEPLRNTYWKLETLYGYPITTQENQREAFIQFTSPKGFTGHSGCNQIFGQYHQQGSLLYFTKVASTKMACIGRADETEQLMIDLLKEPRIWVINKNKLVLFNEKQDAIARFRSVYF